MPILRNARHERFAQELASCKSAIEAYELAGYKPSRSNACGLRTKSHIVERVAELQQRTIAAQDKATAKLQMTTESLIAEATEIQRIALELEQPSAAVAALTAKAKLGGLWIERAENKNETIEHAVGRHPRAAEDWAEKHNATSH